MQNLSKIPGFLEAINALNTPNSSDGGLWNGGSTFGAAGRSSLNAGGGVAASSSGGASGNGGGGLGGKFSTPGAISLRLFVFLFFFVCLLQEACVGPMILIWTSAMSSPATDTLGRASKSWLVLVLSVLVSNVSFSSPLQ